VTATTLALSSEKTGYLSVPGSAFLPKSNTAYDTTANHLDRLAGAAAQMFVAPVNLPNGAIVTTVTTYAYNNDDPGDTLTIYFDKYTLNETAAASNISTINAVTTQSANIQTASHSPNETINNSTIAYALRAVFSTNNANLRLRGVLITYTYDTF
jgi:hypothetical protein